jgi:hypothetical protein
MNWNTIIEDDISTYPEEGYTVIVSDDKNYDTCYYVMSGEYKWVKEDIINDDIVDFKSFNIKKWAYINDDKTRRLFLVRRLSIVKPIYNYTFAIDKEEAIKKVEMKNGEFDSDINVKEIPDSDLDELIMCKNIL